MNCNTSVTVDCNKHYPHLPKKMQEFYDRCKYICEKEHREFTYRDFLDMKHGTFRQYILRLKPYVELVTRDHIAFYKIKGVKLPLDSHYVTFRDTGDVSNLIRMLESTQEQPAKIHDVKMKIDLDKQSAAATAGQTVNPFNHGIQIKQIPSRDDNIVIKASVYPYIIQLDVACTYKPMIYDVESFLYFTEILKEASIFLTAMTHVTLPPVKDWIITHYHLNKDGGFEISGKSFHFTISDVASGLIRFYSKKMKDGRVIPRIEQIQTPNISIIEAMKKAVDMQEQKSGEECWIN